MAKVKKDTKSAKNFILALNALEEERGISKQVVLDALKEALEKSYKKNYLGPDSIVNVTIDENTGKIRLYEIKHVVDDVMDEDYELSMSINQSFLEFKLQQNNIIVDYYHSEDIICI